MSDNPYIKFLNKYLEALVSHSGSDLHLKATSLIRGRINGKIVNFGDRILTKEEAEELAKALVGKRYNELDDKKSLDFTYILNDDYRFRVNLFLQISGISAVFRTIPRNIPTMEELLLPPVLKKIADETLMGLVLVTGPTGSGKTTTIASMINHINHTRQNHIVTIEDPVEFVFDDAKCVINQRAIGQNCNTFADSLRAALREDPDIIFVGEMRDLETIETALHAAETGHLVLSTLHTLDAKESINRVISMFEGEEQNRIRIAFASVLQAVISQRLVATTDNKRRAAVEVLRRSVRIRDMILEDRVGEVTDAIKEGRNIYGTQTFDQHLLDLFRDGIITREEALDKSSNRADLEINIKNIELERKSKAGEADEADEIKLKDIR
ncbi:PilT/PilU family type 4a pilus ATPase [Campylobacter ureolyticus]|uniref:type IV pilus twitching motility protein PilT n=1 Tax=Campylobacter ureolyticus TaxID=827 RepID=UPI00290CE5A9|nr:PilT/PilU family type 4a pilus ATPase [Campylobacter ureolyticus]MDU7071002.1 PilT/PilU family type 4a pilus ATPase [Campylobacter ureolyticus]